jgi:hypothetical protein
MQMKANQNMSSSQSAPSISLGQTFITAKAKHALHPQEVLASLYRHASGDWGRCSMEESAQNQIALAKRMPISSIYTISSGATFRVSTDGDRSATIVSLCHETDLSEAGLVDAWVFRSGCPTCGG